MTLYTVPTCHIIYKTGEEGGHVPFVPLPGFAFANGHSYRPKLCTNKLFVSSDWTVSSCQLSLSYRQVLTFSLHHLEHHI